jgi:hypothetical protein
MGRKGMAVGQANTSRVRGLTGPILPEEPAGSLNSIDIEINDLYSAYDAKAELDVLLTSRQLSNSPTTLG